MGRCCAAETVATANHILKALAKTRLTAELLQPGELVSGMLLQVNPGGSTLALVRVLVCMCVSSLAGTLLFSALPSCLSSTPPVCLRWHTNQHWPLHSPSSLTAVCVTTSCTYGGQSGTV